MIVPTANVVSQQCSPTRIPITDPSLASRIHKASTVPSTTINTIKSSIEKTPTQIEKYPTDHTTPFKSNKTELEQIMDELEHEFTTNLLNINENSNIHWNIVAKKGPNVPHEESVVTTMKSLKKRQRKGKHHKKNKKKYNKEVDREKVD